MIFSCCLDCRAMIAAPRPLVFDRLADHESMGDWPFFSGCRLVVPGTPRNGLGAERAIRHGPFTVVERVVRFSPPRRFDYTLVKGLPIRHYGTIRLRECPEGTLLIWRIRMRSVLPGFTAAVACVLRHALKRIVPYLSASIAAASGAAPPGRPAVRFRMY